MPNWKKVVVSGSDAALNSLIVTNGITGSLLGTASFAISASFINSTTTNAFVQGGNSFGTQALLGTNDDQNLAFETSGSVRMFISSSGNVGIGTSTPSSTLDVSGSGRFTNRLTVTGSFATFATASSGFLSIISGSQPGNDIAFNFRKIGETGGTRHTMIVEGTGGNDTNLYFGVNGVGSSPGASFAVKGNGSVNINMPSPTGNYGGLAVGGWITSYPSLLVRGIGATSATTALRVENSNTSASLVVTDDIRVGIGMAAPSASLQVAGDVRLASAADGANALWIYRTSSNVWSLNSINGVGEIWRVAGNSQTFYQVVTTSNGLNVTPGGNSTTAGLTVTSGSYPAATLLRVDVNALVVTGSRVGVGTLAPTSLLHVSGASSAPLFEIDSPTLNNIMFVSGSGRVGIGTGNPNSTLNVAGTTTLSSSFNTAISGSTLTVIGSGSAQPIFTVQGSQGELFSITDSLSGSLFSVNDISGLPIMEVFSDNTILMGDYQDPMLLTTRKITQTNSGSFVVYSIPTASYDGAFIDYTIKSGSNARAGTIMSTWAGSSIEFTEVDTMDIGSTAAVGLTMILSGSNAVMTGSSSTGAWTIRTIIRTI